MSSQQYDLIIVGQGIAGTMLAYNLIKRQQRVLVIDQGNQNCSSAIAGGIINPVTGKRIVKTWKADELLPVARQTYRELEELLQIKILDEITVCRYHVNPEDPRICEEQSVSDWYQRYVSDLQYQHAGIKNDYGGIAISPALRVYTRELLQAFRHMLHANGRLLEEAFDYDKLQLTPGGVSYNGISAKQVVFCEGQAGSLNPWFSWLPYNLSKGEVLHVRIPGLVPDRLMIPMKGIYFIPLGDDLYYVGSTSGWVFEDEKPTAANKEQLIKKMERALDLDYEIVDHVAAVRPSVKDRRPLIGIHPEHKQLAVFNGMGTKGYSLSPYFAIEMAELLIDGKEVEREAGIDRVGTSGK